MLYNAKELKKYDILATDGTIGTVHDFYLDEDKWTVRYLVVDTMKWLPGKKVLISPMSIVGMDDAEKQIALNLTKEKVKNSPEVNLDLPISKKLEYEFSSYYYLPPYWKGEGFWGHHMHPSELAKDYLDEQLKNDTYIDENDSALRSFKELTGYHIEAIDGQIGHVEDFVISDDTWSVRYMVVDTKNWWPGKHVLVSPDWIKRVNWTDKNVYVDLDVKSIENGPEYKPDTKVTRDLEEDVYVKYNKSKYW